MPKRYNNKEKASEAGKKSSRKGVRNKSTIMKEKLGLTNIEDLQDDVLKVWGNLIKSRNKDDKKFAVKEISKYIFATKKDITASISSFDKFIDEHGDELDS